MGGERGVAFRKRPIEIAGTSLTGSRRPIAHRNESRALVNGFNIEFVDLSGDNRLDVVLAEGLTLVNSLVWLEQPRGDSAEWKLHTIGNYDPDQRVSIFVSDINGNGRPDVRIGGYGRGSRDKKRGVTRDDPRSRLAWFEHSDNPSCR